MRHALGAWQLNPPLPRVDVCYFGAVYALLVETLMVEDDFRISRK